MRTTLLLFLASIAIALSSAGAEPFSPDRLYNELYAIWLNGEKAENASNFTGAMKSYRVVLNFCDKIIERYPNWNPPMLKMRREATIAAIQRVQGRVGKPGDRPSDVDIEGALPKSDTPGFGEELPRPNQPPEEPPLATGGDPFREIQRRLESLQNDLESTRKRLSETTREKDELSTRYEAEVKEARKSADMQARLQSRADRAEEALIKAESDGAKSSETAKKARADFEAIRKQMRDFKIEREAEEELRRQTAGRLAATNKKLEVVSQERDQARKENSQGPAKLEAMQKEIDKALKEKGEINAKLDKTQESLQKVTEDREKVLSELTRLKESQKQVDKLIQDNATLTAKLGDAEKLILQFKGDGTKKDEQIASLRKEVTLARQQLDEAQKQSDNSQQQLAELRAKLDAQQKTLAAAKTDATTSQTERKKLVEENEVLRGIVVREMKEQARRDQTKKLVLGELSRLELKSKSLLQQIDYLGQPVVKLTEKERKLFKKPVVEISEAEISIAAANDTPPEAPASSDPKLNAAPSPSDAAPAAEKNSLQKSNEAAPERVIGDKEKEPTASNSQEPTQKPDALQKSAPSSVSRANGSAPPNVPAELIPLAQEAKEHFERANYRDAEKVYEKILAKAPNNLYALSNMGVVRFRSGKLQLAEETFKKAIAIAPEDAFSHCTLGIIYYSGSKYDEAVQSLTKALALQPKNATAHNYLGITASQKGWQEAAHNHLETATAIDPNYADAFFNLAVVYATQQPPNKTAARKCYQRAIELGSEPDGSLDKLIK
jgi:tetratricopeptide (TPR) repeat protein